jgi:uncharacterized protein YjbI with pentapeptide repeats
MEGKAMTLIRDTKWVTLLREAKVEEFNRQAAGQPPVLANADLRMLDLREADLHNADLHGAYLRDTDLRGLDLSAANLDRASLHAANVSGVLFPGDLTPEEIRLSLDFGTRMRVS